MADLTQANSTYQSGIPDTASTLVDNVDTAMARHVNGPDSAIIQIEAVLGNAPLLIGTVADLQTRLSKNIQPDGTIIPPGTIWMYAGSSAPTGWLLCDGSSISRTTYANLFGAIGTTYGSVDGNSFNVPDSRGRVPIGVGTGTGGGASGTGLPTGGSALTAVVRGTWKGEETHVLTVGELAQHNHTITDPTHSHSYNLDSGAGASIGNTTIGAASLALTGAAATGITVNNTGSNTAHNNIQPVMGFNFIIKI